MKSNLEILVNYLINGFEFTTKDGHKIVLQDKRLWYVREQQSFENGKWSEKEEVLMGCDLDFNYLIKLSEELTEEDVFLLTSIKVLNSDERSIWKRRSLTGLKFGYKICPSCGSEALYKEESPHQYGYSCASCFKRFEQCQLCNNYSKYYDHKTGNDLCVVCEGKVE